MQTFGHNSGLKAPACGVTLCRMSETKYLLQPAQGKCNSQAGIVLLREYECSFDVHVSTSETDFSLKSAEVNEASTLVRLGMYFHKVCTYIIIIYNAYPAFISELYICLIYFFYYM